jgi:lipopolysaccharide/colanic/teichoic acid biosynthesis glycosyltransferase
MWKLRTMNAVLQAGLAGGPPLTAPNDGRVTRVGRYLRSVHLDELPQVLNVAHGEMALIGPRPESPEFVDGRREWQRTLAVPPGILGPTQLLVGDWEAIVLGGPRAAEEYATEVLPLKLAIDGWYIANASPLIDALVIGSTVGKVLFGWAPRRLATVVKNDVPAAVAVIHAHMEVPRA